MSAFHFFCCLLLAIATSAVPCTHGNLCTGPAALSELSQVSVIKDIIQGLIGDPSSLHTVQCLRRPGSTSTGCQAFCILLLEPWRQAGNLFNISFLANVRSEAAVLQEWFLLNRAWLSQTQDVLPLTVVALSSIISESPCSAVNMQDPFWRIWLMDATNLTNLEPIQPSVLPSSTLTPLFLSPQYEECTEIDDGGMAVSVPHNPQYSCCLSQTFGWMSVQPRSASTVLSPTLILWLMLAIIPTLTTLLVIGALGLFFLYFKRRIRGGPFGLGDELGLTPLPKKTSPPCSPMGLYEDADFAWGWPVDGYEAPPTTPRLAKCPDCSPKQCVKNLQCQLSPRRKSPDTHGPIPRRCDITRAGTQCGSRRSSQLASSGRLSTSITIPRLNSSGDIPPGITSTQDNASSECPVPPVEVGRDECPIYQYTVWF